MCWFSTEYASQIEEAKAGQRLGIKQMQWHSNWVVRETEFDAPRPPSMAFTTSRIPFQGWMGVCKQLRHLSARLHVTHRQVWGSASEYLVFDKA